MTTEPKMPPLPEPAYPDCYVVPRTGGATRDGYSIKQMRDLSQQWAERVAELEQALGVAREDAERMQWLLDGNGYFMEENFLCGHGPCNESEKNEARATIDAARSKEGGE